MLGLRLGLGLGLSELDYITGSFAQMSKIKLFTTSNGRITRLLKQKQNKDIKTKY